MKLILCAALAIASATASAGVNKCVDQQGHVLFTDAECPQASTQESAIAPAPAESVASTMPTPMAPMERRSRWADLPHALVRKPAGIDAATLQAAHQSMLIQDELRKPRRLLSAR